jgi:hypothetical protein
MSERSLATGAPLVEYSDYALWGRGQSIDTTPRDDDQYHRVMEGQRIEYLAHDLLGDVRHAWVVFAFLVADLEQVVHPEEIPAGTLVRLPSRQRLEMDILSKVVE